MMNLTRTLFLLAAVMISTMALGGEEVIVYTALDRGFSEPILKNFETKTGIRVRAVYDTEVDKTVGLVNKIRAERSRPRCDIFWNNEIVNTIRLKKEGLLAPYRSPAAETYPNVFRDSDGYWTGFAGRARVILVNTDMVKAGQFPTSIQDFLKPEWKGKVGIAKPLAGTTASHAACLFALWGEAKAKEFFLQMKANNVRVESGNKQVALNVAAGRLAFGLTDTDDAIIEVEKGKPVKILYPDAANDLGVLFIPNTLALVNGGPNTENAKKLIDYLLAPEVEIALSTCSSAQIPLNTAVTEKPRVKTPKDVTAMQVDFEKAAAAFDTAALFIRNEFLK